MTAARPPRPRPGPVVPTGGAGATVLVVEDDPTIAEVVIEYLRSAGHVVVGAADGVTGLQLARAAEPDLVVLDVMLPGLDGLEVCTLLREVRPDLPVIMLTALGDEGDRIAGLGAGADDYVVKPFSPRELVLRVEAVLRRSSPRIGDLRSATVMRSVGARRIVAGQIVVDLPTRTVARDNAPISLTTREFDLLIHLMSHPEQVYSPEQLLKEVWGWEFGDTSTVTVHVRRVREKVEPDPANPRHLLTVWGVGYRWSGSAAYTEDANGPGREQS